MFALLKKMFSSDNERFIKSLAPVIDEVNSHENSLEQLSDDELKAKTLYFRQIISTGKTLDDILPEAFAVVREAAKRNLKMRHFDVQLIGGIVLHRGKIAEMKTGEGKTLVATLAAYLNALSSQGVHVITVNDYLAKRDAEWMRPVYEALGLNVGVIVANMDKASRKEAYSADITYGTNNEFGFDYLRDNMCFRLDDMVQRPFNFAIIDEVDSVLIDEARTPLIISGPVEDRTDLYVKINNIIPLLQEDCFEKDEKANSVILTDKGVNLVEAELVKREIIADRANLYDIENISVVHHVNQALKAHKLFTRDKDYLVKDGQLYIIDEFTGRIMDGRRFGDGLHQALEAREGLVIQNENQTLATITYQNYFRMYPKLAGMTGTALTEAEEFNEIYKLKVVEIPTNIPVARIDDNDNIYRTEEEKFQAIAALIQERVANKQPVLAGTASVEKSELLSKYLNKLKIKHNILNAKNHSREAYIIAQAGRPAAVTVATNMAGRGTDIKLGGNVEYLLEEKLTGGESAEEIAKITAKIAEKVAEDKKTVIEAGGLCVIGTERHESRRIDNQLRGRSGRQGDPGYTKFYLSTQDDLIRVFGADKKMDWIMTKMGEDGEPVEHPLITKIMAKAQSRVEERNFEIRKTLLRFDDVMNDQRKVIYSKRVSIMKADNVSEEIDEMIDELSDYLIEKYIPQNSYREKWELHSLHTEVNEIFGLDIDFRSLAKSDDITPDILFDKIATEADKLIQNRRDEYGLEMVQSLEKRIYLFVFDQSWKEHLHFLDLLRKGINLRAYAQKDPLNEYKKEAFEAFNELLFQFKKEYLKRLCHIKIESKDEQQNKQAIDALRSNRMIETSNNNPLTQKSNGNNAAATVTIRTNVTAEERDPADPNTWGKVSRNELCPCGSSKKYKQCHGKL